MYSSAEANAPKAAEVAAGGSLAVLCFVDVFIELLRDLKLQRRGSAVPLASYCWRIQARGSLPHDPNIATCNSTLHCPWGVRDSLLDGDPKLSFRNSLGKTNSAHRMSAAYAVT